MISIEKNATLGGHVAGEIIRLGDRTSHNGTVIEGSQTDICMGKPIAYIGHKVHCPKCKGDYPIVEGVMTTTFYGKGVAVAGMKTSCGATLIAGQFTDIVEWGGGSSISKGTGTTVLQLGAGEARLNKPSVGVPSPGSRAAPSAAEDDKQDEFMYDEQFQLKDENGVILAAMPYTVRLPSGQLIHSVTDDEGHTGRYRTDDADDIEICLGHIES
jgi:uncharacterized Zn-binding protein involved in type VI secretion